MIKIIETYRVHYLVINSNKYLIIKLETRHIIQSKLSTTGLI